MRGEKITKKPFFRTESLRIAFEKRSRAERIFSTKERRAKRIAGDRSRAMFPTFDFVKGKFRK